MDIEFYILRHQDAVYDRVYISFRTFQQKRDDSKDALDLVPIFFGDALWPKLIDNFLVIFTLEGAGRQIVDTRSIFGLLLTNVGYNGSN